jgi:hypothetical protein
MNRGVDPGLLEPCGTPAAARRHQRRHEPLDEACRRAASLARTRYAQGDGPGGRSLSPDTREIRNGLPWKAYAYRGRGPFLHEEEDECA